MKQSGPFQCDACGTTYAIPMNQAQERQQRERGSFDCMVCRNGDVSHAHHQEHTRLRVSVIELRRTCRKALKESNATERERAVLAIIEGLCTYALTGVTRSQQQAAVNTNHRGQA